MNIHPQRTKGLHHPYYFFRPIFMAFEALDPLVPDELLPYHECLRHLL